MLVSVILLSAVAAVRVTAGVEVVIGDQTSGIYTKTFSQPAVEEVMVPASDPQPLVYKVATRHRGGNYVGRYPGRYPPGNGGGGYGGGGYQVYPSPYPNVYPGGGYPGSPGRYPQRPVHHHYPQQPVHYPYYGSGGPISNIIQGLTQALQG